MAYKNKQERIENTVQLLSEVEERFLLEENNDKKKDLKTRLKFYRQMAETILTKEEYDQVTMEATKKAYENARKTKEIGSYNYNGM